MNEFLRKGHAKKMYGKIYEYGVFNGIASNDGLRTCTILGYIHLDADGNYINIEPINKKEAEQKKIPTLGSQVRTAKWSEVLYEKAVNIFDKVEGKKHAIWVQLMLMESDIPIVIAIQNFIQRYEHDENFAAEVFERYEKSSIGKNDIVGFKVDGVCPESVPAVSQWLSDIKAFMAASSVKKSSEPVSETIVSSITGRYGEPVPPENCPWVTNVPKESKAAFGIGSGVYIESAKEPAFSHYGFEKAQSSQMLVDEARTIASTLEYLLSDPNHHNRDFKVFYFYSMDNIDDLLTSAMDVSEDQLFELVENADAYDTLLSRILNCVYTGEQFVCPDTSATFYMARFLVQASAQGRFLIADETEGDYRELANSIYKWYDDTRIISYIKQWQDDEKKYKVVKKDRVIGKIYNILLKCLANKDADDVNRQIEIEFGNTKAALLRSIFTGEQIPSIYYRRAINEVCRSAIIEGNVTTCVKTNKTNTVVYLQIIKAYLRRKGVNIMPELNNENVSTAYSCGRMFAVAEQAQKSYHNYKKLNKNFMQSHYKGFVRYPSVFFSDVAYSAEKYIQGIESDGTRIYLKNLLVEIVSSINSVPKTFSFDEQGEFIMGYYHQCNAMRKNKSVDESDAEMLDEEEKVVEND